MLEVLIAIEGIFVSGECMKCCNWKTFHKTQWGQDRIWEGNMMPHPCLIHHGQHWGGTCGLGGGGGGAFDEWQIFFPSWKSFLILVLDSFCSLQQKMTVAQTNQTGRRLFLWEVINCIALISRACVCLDSHLVFILWPSNLMPLCGFLFQYFEFSSCSIPPWQNQLYVFIHSAFKLLEIWRKILQNCLLRGFTSFLTS